MELGLGLGLRRRHLMASAPVFSPSQISGLKFWLDASDTSTLTVDGSNRMSSAADKSGNGYASNQNDTSQMPLSGTRNINGLNVLDFDGSNDGLIVQPVLSVSTGPNTVFAVGAVDTNAQSQAFVQGMNNTNTRQFLGYGTSGTTVSGQNGSSSASSSTITPDLNTHILAMSVFSQVDVYYDGVTVANASISGTQSITGLGIGRRSNSSSSSQFNGRIAEILIYDRALSGAEKNQVGQYLATKWNASWTDHGYTTIATLGDSITEGNAASTAANRWANIVASSMGAQLLNKGISSTLLQNTLITGGVPSANNGRDRYLADICGRNRADYAVILYGVNDVRLMQSEPSLSLDEFSNDYQEIITGLLADGYTRDKIIIGSPPYFTSYISGDTTGATRLADCVARVRTLAVTNQVKYADVHQYMVDNGAGSLLSGDNLHPNDSGHVAIATAILAADYVS